MIKLENAEVIGWKAAIRGMRNPKNSWDRSDSNICAYYEGSENDHCGTCPHSNFGCYADDGDIETRYIIGPKDHELMMNLAKGGPVHAKYRRMIIVYVDITAPLYWWKEFDTYKIGTVANSCSTMHKIADKEFTIDDFSVEHLVSGWPGKDSENWDIITPGPSEYIDNLIEILNQIRNTYLVALKTEEETGLSAKDIWWQMIQLLPSSYNQKRTVMLNYEVLNNIYYSPRYNHKLDEWVEFCEWIKTLPYSEIIIGGTDET